MMTPELPPLVQRALERLIRAFAPERVVLFGSYAKGTTHVGSDVDLLIVARIVGSMEPYQRRARQLTSDCFPPVDVVLCTPEDIADTRAVRSLFLQRVLKNGITLYSRS